MSDQPAPRRVAAAGHLARHIEPVMTFADARRGLEPTAESDAVGIAFGIPATGDHQARPARTAQHRLADVVLARRVLTAIAGSLAVVP